MKISKVIKTFLISVLAIVLMACSNPNDSSGSNTESNTTKNSGSDTVSDDSPVTYRITISNGITDGTVTTNSSFAAAGVTVTLTITPEGGYLLNSISVETNGNTVSLSGTGNTRTFTMPEGNVTVSAGFAVDYTRTGCTSLPAGSNGTAGTSRDYVLFGYWPQSLKPEGVTIDTTQTQTIASFSCYKGSDNNWYYKYQQNNNYFRVESIKWRVITTNFDHDGNHDTQGKKLLLAEKILQAVPFLADNFERDIGGKNLYPNNYAYSEIRAWLNGDSYYKWSEGHGIEWNELIGNGFLQFAFNSQEQAAIAETTVINNARSTNPDGDSNANLWNNGDNQYECENTVDKIFLLSEQEITNSSYGFTAYDVYGDGNSRIRMPTDYAIATGAYQSRYAGCGGYWWLRSPYFEPEDNNYEVRFISTSGNPGRGEVNHVGMGVVPALCLNN